MDSIVLTSEKGVEVTYTDVFFLDLEEDHGEMNERSGCRRVWCQSELRLT